jgi:hypothetical protein
MSTTSVPAKTVIPYVKQADPETSRMCGAASLAMVYGSFSKEVSQAEIWPKIAKVNRFGSLACNTHLMVQDALDRGFVAMAIQAKHPLQALAFCRDNGVRAILNHRATEETAAGHYSVFVDINTEHVTFHDPYYGPGRRVANAEWLELWQPRFGNAEIVGNVLIAIGEQAQSAPPCPMCHVVIPPTVACPKCQEPVPLQPARLLGCVGTGCANRMWNYVCCRSCDFMWSFSLDEPPPKPTSGPGGQPFSVNSAFSELEKFWAQVMTSEKAANHPELRKQVEFMKASKEKIALAQVETLVAHKAREAQSSDFRKKCKLAEEAILKKREEIATPASPLDGNALGLALVKALGLLDDRKAAQQAVPVLNGSGSGELPIPEQLSAGALLRRRQLLRNGR